MPHMSALASGLKAFAILHRMPNLNLIRFVPDFRLYCAYLMQFVADFGVESSCKWSLLNTLRMTSVMS